jgi:hypothetical protein
MVQQGDFKVELVDAITKVPFIEHTRDNGDTFVEAEPKAEYLIRFEKTAAVASAHVPFLCIDFFVDGGDLCVRRNICGTTIDCAGGGLYGPKDFVHGNWVEHALRFDIPHRQATQEKFSVDSFVEKMGRVDIKVYEGFRHHEKPNCDHLPLVPKFGGSAATFAVSRNGGEQDKAVLSTKGTAMTSTAMTGTAVARTTSMAGTAMAGTAMARTSIASRSRLCYYTVGRLLDTVTLRYCSVKGLQLIGILAPPATPAGGNMPLLWLLRDPARQRNGPHNTREPAQVSPHKIKKVRYSEDVVDVGRNGLVHEVNVITILDDEDSDDEGNKDESNHKM